MEVKYKDTFFESLKKLARRETWWYKIWDTIRWDIPRFFLNTWRFRKELYDFHAWESMYALGMLRRGLELNADYIETYGMEIAESKGKKVSKIRRAIEIMEWHECDDFLKLAEESLNYEYDLGKHWFEKIEGKTYDNPFGKDGEDLFEWKSDNDEETESKNKKLVRVSKEIEDSTWKELFEILHGQDYSEIDALYNKLSDEEKMTTALYDNWYDGSGMKGWWD